MATGFIFKDHDAAIEYYERKEAMDLKTEKECHELLLQMAREGKMKSIFSNNRTPDEWLADQRKAGFKIDDWRTLDDTESENHNG